MAIPYTTKDGDMVDEICWRVYNGIQRGTAERVYQANPILAQYGPKLPAGLVLQLPDIPPPEPIRVVRVWG